MSYVIRNLEYCYLWVRNSPKSYPKMVGNHWLTLQNDWTSRGENAHFNWCMWLNRVLILLVHLRSREPVIVTYRLVARRLRCPSITPRLLKLVADTCRRRHSPFAFEWVTGGNWICYIRIRLSYNALNAGWRWRTGWMNQYDSRGANAATTDWHVNAGTYACCTLHELSHQQRTTGRSVEPGVVRVGRQQDLLYRR